MLSFGSIINENVLLTWKQKTTISYSSPYIKAEKIKDAHPNTVINILKSDTYIITLVNLQYGLIRSILHIAPSIYLLYFIGQPIQS